MTRQRKILLAGLALIAAANLTALSGAIYNRSGEPEAVLELTERELALPQRHGFGEENSGLALSLAWRIAAEAGDDPYQTSYTQWSPAPWLTPEKLQALGFALPADISGEREAQRVQKQLPRPAYLVFEYQGDAHRQALAARERELAQAQQQEEGDPDPEQAGRRIEQARERLQDERLRNSRLFLIDAGPEAAPLRQRYPDRARHMILRGEIGLNVERVDDRYVASGRVHGILVDTVNVPLELRAVFDALERAPRQEDAEPGPRYTVRLAVGKRYEPWIETASALAQP